MWQFLVGLAQVLGATFAFIAIVFAWSDRVARERPQILFREFRRWRGGDVPAATNIGLGPAYEVQLLPLQFRIQGEVLGHRLNEVDGGAHMVARVDALQAGEELDGMWFARLLARQLPKYMNLVEDNGTFDFHYVWAVRLAYADRSRNAVYMEEHTIIGDAKYRCEVAGERSFKIEPVDVSIVSARPERSWRTLRWRRIFGGLARLRRPPEMHP